jgi:hypothetical protein
MEAVAPVAPTAAPAAPAGVTVIGAPAPAPAAAPAAPAMETPPIQTGGAGSFAEGGATNTNTISGFFKSLNWLEIGMLILGSIGIYYSIYYHKNKIKQEASIHPKFQKKIDEIEMNLKTAMGKKYKSAA